MPRSIGYMPPDGASPPLPARKRGRDLLPGSQAGHQIPAFTRHLRAISFTSHLLHLDGGFPGNHRDIPLLRIARVYLKDLQRRVAGHHSADHNSKQRA